MKAKSRQDVKARTAHIRGVHVNYFQSLTGSDASVVMGTIMLDHKFLVCSSTIYARAWAKFSARA